MEFCSWTFLPSSPAPTLFIPTSTSTAAAMHITQTTHCGPISATIPFSCTAAYVLALALALALALTHTHSHKPHSRTRTVTDFSNARRPRYPFRPTGFGAWVVNASRPILVHGTAKAGKMVIGEAEIKVVGAGGQQGTCFDSFLKDKIGT